MQRLNWYYVCQKLASQLLEEFDIQFFAELRRNRKNKLIRFHDMIMYHKHSIIEIINEHLKNVYQIEHSRHRGFINLFCNVLCGLIAYCHQPKKPNLYLDWLFPQSV
ncbi:transposase [Nostoc sp. CHAB 5824]|nr:transposase [Nostoc sp. CHAB 5824]